MAVRKNAMYSCCQLVSKYKYYLQSFCDRDAYLIDLWYVIDMFFLLQATNKKLIHLSLKCLE